MFNFYKPPFYESQTINDFLNQEKINEILYFYDDTTREICNLENTTECRIVEINCHPIKKIIQTIKYVAKGKYINLPFDEDHPIIQHVKQANLFSWITDISDYLESEFTKHGVPAKLVDLNIHNLHKPFEIHCDGIDIKEKNNERPRTFPKYDMQQYNLISLNDRAHQGLITLRNDDQDNGTIVFDQWFPISTYLEQHKSHERKKENIRFFKGEPLERFGETVRNYTNQPMPDNHFAEIMNVVKHKNLFTREQAYGLTLDKILKFGQPGTLNMWAVKKYHMTIPKKKQDWSKNRILLQYESEYIGEA